jgi:hypothetical protein
MVFSILALSVPLAAKEKKGDDLIVEKTDGQKVRGELIAVKNSSLLLLDSKRGDVSVNIDEIMVIKIVGKSRFLLAAGTGLILGAGIGALIGSSMHKPNTFVLMGPELGALIGAGAGAFIGIIIESFINSDKTIQFEGRSELEIKKIIEDLRKKTRVPNFR